MSEVVQGLGLIFERLFAITHRLTWACCHSVDSGKLALSIVASGHQTLALGRFGRVGLDLIRLVCTPTESLLPASFFFPLLLSILSVTENYNSNLVLLLDDTERQTAKGIHRSLQSKFALPSQHDRLTTWSSKPLLYCLVIIDDTSWLICLSNAIFVHLVNNGISFWSIFFLKEKLLQVCSRQVQLI